ncbi:MAG: thiamine-phosphate kinase [Candidatus Jordarchaeales archaeon]|nr:thiamine-phosphate kinase [Candidatus Jordarchaeia archaeon]
MYVIMDLSGLGERKLVERLLGFVDDWYSSSEDAAAIQIGGITLVFSSDMLVARTDVPPGMTWKQVGWKVVVMNLSDLAAKGAEPIGGLYAFGLPKWFKVNDALEIASGIKEASNFYGARYLGGDVNESDEVVVSGAVLGVTEKFVPRGGAKPGEVVAVTGPFGLTAAGLKILLEGLESGSEKDRCLKTVYQPEPRIREGVTLAKGGYASSCIDSSDGLAASLHELAKASKVGFAIDNVPIPPEVLVFAQRNGLDPYELALYGGEEYELVATIPEAKWEDAVKAVEKVGGSLHRIGRVIQENEVKFKHPEEGWVKISWKGYEHFTS